MNQKRTEDGGIEQVAQAAGMIPNNGALAQGMQLLQIRTQNQMLLAVQRPRDMRRFEAELLRQAAEAGDDFYYSIPYKTHAKDCRTPWSCTCPAKPVEGPGVGLAREAARLFGNCSVYTELEEETSDHWLVRSTFVDFETNFSRSESKRVGRLVKRGGQWRAPTERESDVIYQIGASKVERDVILRALPRHIIERGFERAKAAALASERPLPEQLDRLARRFSEVGVTLGMLERYVGTQFTPAGLAAAGVDARETCAHLRGVLTAIKGGESTAEELFGSGRAAVVEVPVGPNPFEGQARIVPPKAPDPVVDVPPAPPTPRTLTTEEGLSVWGAATAAARGQGVEPTKPLLMRVVTRLLTDFGAERLSQLKAEYLDAFRDRLTRVDWAAELDEPPATMPAFPSQEDDTTQEAGPSRRRRTQ